MTDVITPEQKEWPVIFPLYMNKKKKLSEGRRLGKDKCVDNPSAQEIYDLVKTLRFECVLEKEKSHPRDWLHKGRVRVKLRDENKEPINPDFPTRRALMIQVAERLPELREQKSKKSQNPQKNSGRSKSSTNKKKKRGGGRRRRG
eukprot:TRINITY_DN1495_c0_g1_i1.p1 TRINITY_DN1495_c0_g1~~TRINITY_DN1495_c0_g1_i1.p1  ORF type:complete len:145 (-),score=33.20 TRINITY_DN1495_c0_g1_i1:27-461(-)